MNQYNLFMTVDNTENYQLIRISTKTEHAVSFSSIQGMKLNELRYNCGISDVWENDVRYVTGTAI